MKTAEERVEGIRLGLQNDLITYRERLANLKEQQKHNAVRIREIKRMIAYISSGGYNAGVYQRIWADSRNAVNRIEAVRNQVRELMRDTKAHLQALK